jgi:hypothetical protein
MTGPAQIQKAIDNLAELLDHANECEILNFEGAEKYGLSIAALRQATPPQGEPKVTMIGESFTNGELTGTYGYDAPGVPRLYAQGEPGGVAKVERQAALDALDRVIEDINRPRTPDEIQHDVETIRKALGE